MLPSSDNSQGAWVSYLYKTELYQYGVYLVIFYKGIYQVIFTPFSQIKGKWYIYTLNQVILLPVICNILYILQTLLQIAANELSYFHQINDDWLSIWCVCK